MAMMAITTKSSINVNANPPHAPLFWRRARARLASFHLMAAKYSNPGWSNCRWWQRAVYPNNAGHWRAAKDDQFGTQMQSARPRDQPGWASFFVNLFIYITTSDQTYLAILNLENSEGKMAP